MPLRRPCIGASTASPLCSNLAEPGRARCAACEWTRSLTVVTLDDEFDRNASIVRSRAGPNCPRCGVAYDDENPLTIEHVHPREHGGTNRLENLAPLCRRCNSQLGAHTNVTKLEQHEQLEHRTQPTRKAHTP